MGGGRRGQDSGPPRPHVRLDLRFLNIYVFFHLWTHFNHTPSAFPSQLQTKCSRHSTAHMRGPLPFTKAGGRAQLGDGRASK